MIKAIPFIFFISFSILYAQETVEGIRRQIQSVEAETAREKSLHEAEKKHHAEFVESSRKKVVALTAQNQTLKTGIDSLQNELSRLSAARNKAAGVTRWYESRRLRYQESLATTLDSLVPFLENDFPCKASEAAESMREIASQLKKGIISADDALGRAMEVLGERIRMGYTTEIWEGFLAAPDGRSIPGKYFRYGTVAAIFVSGDGENVFWLSRTNEGYHWNFADNDFTFRASLKEAMKVAEGKEAPHIVEIPIAGMPPENIQEKKKEAK